MGVYTNIMAQKRRRPEYDQFNRWMGMIVEAWPLIGMIFRQTGFVRCYTNIKLPLPMKTALMGMIALIGWSYKIMLRSGDVPRMTSFTLVDENGHRLTYKVLFG
jgi:hypothetical protein